MKMNVKQGSAEWLALRKTKVTASDASIILGLNPFQKDVELLIKQKHGFYTPFENDAMRRGTLMEPEARDWYNQKMGILVEPDVYISDIHDFMLASVDGYDGSTLIEIKCGKKSYEDAKKGKIAKYYNAQMQHQMFVVNAPWCDYVAYSESEEPIIIRVERDMAFIKEMIAKEWEFYYDLIGGD